MRSTAIILLLFLWPGLAAEAETVSVEADRDATLIEDPDGAAANGSGASLFVGRTGQDQNAARRALLHFDVAAALPEQAIVEEVYLTLYMTPGRAGSRELRLYRVLAEWGEGPSSSSGGRGAPSEPGDATWLHRFYDWEFWVHSGGQFRGRASAERVVDDSGFYTWPSTNNLVQDVRLWKSAPNRNFGWIVIGDETTRRSVKSFASREHPERALRPVLQIFYRLPGDRRR